MSKSFISISAASTPLATVNLSTLNGGRLVAVGKWGPAFEQAEPKCAECADFRTATVRRNGVLISISCPCVTKATRTTALLAVSA
ncbi:hypothetical protein [Streptomyces sp. LN325]|uniref:hypothetical protein n=1 Tax=Streptomyces sp. LN325 TaxID=3112976 RepID=UPI00371BD986